MNANSSTPQLALFDQSERESERAAPGEEAAKPDALRKRLQGIDPDTMSPREALDLLYELKALGPESD